MQKIEDILTALSKVRINKTMDEHHIHEEIKKVLDKEKIRYKHEYKLLSHKRFDFWIDGIILEVKKQKPQKMQLLNQLNRYTKVPDVKAIIIVLERSINLPKTLNDKPIIVKSLNANWGVAI